MGSSLSTSFIFIKLLHPDIILLQINKWDWGNLFNGYNFWGQSLLFAFISWILIYWVIPKLISIFIMNKLVKKFDTMLSNPLNRIRIGEYLKEVIKKLIRLINKISLKRYRVDPNKYVYYDEMSTSLLSLFSLSIHIFICVLYFLKTSNIILISLFSLWIFIIIYHIIYIPVFKEFMNMLNKFVEDESKVTKR